MNDDGTPADVVYIGKSESERRVRDEVGWAAKDPHSETELYGAFVNTVRRNRAELFPIATDPDLARNDGFDPAPLLELLDGLDGDSSYYKRLRKRVESGVQWSIPDIERFLMRVAVRCGVPIANASGTSGWINLRLKRDPRDVMAVVATDAVKAAEWPIQKTCAGCSWSQKSVGL